MEEESTHKRSVLSWAREVKAGIAVSTERRTIRRIGNYYYEKYGFPDVPGSLYDVLIDKHRLGGKVTKSNGKYTVRTDGRLLVTAEEVAHVAIDMLIDYNFENKLESLKAAGNQKDMVRLIRWNEFVAKYASLDYLKSNGFAQEYLQATDDEEILQRFPFEIATHQFAGELAIAVLESNTRVDLLKIIDNGPDKLAENLTALNVKEIDEIVAQMEDMDTIF